VELRRGGQESLRKSDLVGEGAMQSAQPSPPSATEPGGCAGVPGVSTGLSSGISLGAADAQGIRGGGRWEERPAPREIRAWKP